MLRRRLACALSARSVAAVSCYRYAAHSAVENAAGNAADNVAKDEWTRNLSKVKEEIRGQQLDLQDMADSTRKSLKGVQDTVKKYPVSDEHARAKLKMQSVSTSLKAYASRLNNVKNEAESLSQDLEEVLRTMWNTTAEERASDKKKAAGKPAAAAADFGIDPPEVAETIEQMNGDRPAVERVDAEVVRDAPKSNNASTSEEIEVDAVEIEADSEVDDMSVTDITAKLHDEGISFSDCFDAASLRTRYKEFLAGKFKKEEKTPPPPSQTSPSSYNSPNPYQNQQQQRQQTSNPGTDLAQDPYPGASRRRVDPMRYIRDLKKELAAENNTSADAIDIWSNGIRLDDNKRLYEYPGASSYPLEIRNKGDTPSGAPRY